MKTTIHLLLTGQLIVLLQQAFGKYNGATLKYSFQPLPSYWAMVPDSREMIMHAKRK